MMKLGDWCFEFLMYCLCHNQWSALMSISDKVENVGQEQSTQPENDAANMCIWESCTFIPLSTGNMWSSILEKDSWLLSLIPSSSHTYIWWPTSTNSTCCIVWLTPLWSTYNHNPKRWYLPLVRLPLALREQGVKVILHQLIRSN